METHSSFDVGSNYGANVNVYEFRGDRNQSSASVWICLSVSGGALSSSLTLDQAAQVRDAIDACIRAQRGEA